MENQFTKPMKIGKHEIINRFLANPAEYNHAKENGCFSSYVIDRYQKLAKGGWGMVVLENTCVNIKDKCRERTLILDNTKAIHKSWTDFFKLMKRSGNNMGTKWIIQLPAAGYKNVAGPRKSIYKGQPELPNGEVYFTAE